ncbi:PepSY domain-containing protein [Sporosarcina sp. HYO08]|uniref:PepSY domain-containing protein n=1 Tax=Sporosarcina sp. HYO08 TaxID=1759557 RepID=UPI000793AA27|nr:PepSY domain-containing protein [Sporosarcina sp. HYO08]KXH83826.1 hypothetical protein AU377_03425 [Sporosarcina sp. HYO08]
MKLLKKPWLIPVILTILILVAGDFFTKQFVTKAEAMPEGEIRHQLEEMYGGQVKQLALKGLVYEVELTNKQGIYEMEVDAETGKVLSLAQTKKETSTAKQDEKNHEVGTAPSDNENLPKDVQKENIGQNEKPTGSSELKEETVLISKQQAINIALAQQKGEVDDVDFVRTESGGYYIVEIEVENDARGDEVYFQIHAISGKILSVTWDD